MASRALLATKACQFGNWSQSRSHEAWLSEKHLPVWKRDLAREHEVTPSLIRCIFKLRPPLKPEEVIVNTYSARRTQKASLCV
jgi:hypothetical protein